MGGDSSGQSKGHLIFTYGTLKRGFPNHGLMQSLIDQNDAVFLGTHVTLHSYPLVCGPNGIPYLINLPGSGHRVKGELYSVSTRGLGRLDELEGTALGHYERLPIQTQAEAEAEAEAYYAHRSFGEELWEKNGREGLSEYTEREASGYVRREDRPKDRSFVDEVQFSPHLKKAFPASGPSVLVMTHVHPSPHLQITSLVPEFPPTVSTLLKEELSLPLYDLMIEY